MSQATTTALAAAVAPVAAQQQQQQQQQAAFISDPMNDPYPKWTPNQIGVIPSASESYQRELFNPSLAAE